MLEDDKKEEEKKKEQEKKKKKQEKKKKEEEKEIRILEYIDDQIRERNKFIDTINKEMMIDSKMDDDEDSDSSSSSSLMDNSLLERISQEPIKRFIYTSI